MDWATFNGVSYNAIPSGQQVGNLTPVPRLVAVVTASDSEPGYGTATPGK